MQAPLERGREVFEAIWNRIQPELLTPKVCLERSWELNGGSVNHYMYLARPFPKFRLGALQKCFKDYLEQHGVPHDQKTVVGGRYHRYEPKLVLELKRFKINPAFLAGKMKEVFSYRLTFRASWAGVTAVFWVRAVCVTVYKNYKLDNPVEFVSSLLVNTLNYPRYVVLESIEKGKVDAMLKEHEQVRINDRRGWRIEL